MWKTLSGCFNGIDGNKGPIVPSFPEFNNTISECEQRKIPADTNIFSGMINRSALTNDDVTRDGRLATKYFYTEAFAL